MKCDHCGEREAKYSSHGGAELCHDCAHDLGLVHHHKGIGIFPHEHKEAEGTNPRYEDQTCQDSPCSNAPLGCSDKSYCPREVEV